MKPTLCRTTPSSAASSKRVRWRTPSSCSTKCVTKGFRRTQ
uniref:Uncharacterized protein n=1 Tax=Arundo donax TaxID=35708 RepID=A0A0A9GUJ1_ARUDO